jgi:hypothetical protein
VYSFGVLLPVFDLVRYTDGIGAAAGLVAEVVATEDPPGAD